MTDVLSLLKELPPLAKGDVKAELCTLETEPLPRVTSLPEAWNLLPAEGQGVVTLAGEVVRFDASRREGLLVEADVVNGNETVILRSDGDGWLAWRQVEGKGDTHVFVERRYMSCERGHEGSPLLYRQYYTRCARGWEADGSDAVEVWTPVGARFCGFKEARS